MMRLRAATSILMQSKYIEIGERFFMRLRDDRHVLMQSSILLTGVNTIPTDWRPPVPSPINHCTTMSRNMRTFFIQY